MNEREGIYILDYKRYGERGPASKWIRRFLYYFRKASQCNSIFKYYYRYRYKLCCRQHLLEIPLEIKVGGGFYIGHPYGITINKNVIMGKNINIHKGVTIGQENRGKRKGTPVIGNSVWIGVNSTIVGNILIGDDVLIAPNTYINCDIPSHSVVYGNPCCIVPRENATKDYVEHVV